MYNVRMVPVLWHNYFIKLGFKRGMANYTQIGLLTDIIQWLGLFHPRLLFLVIYSTYRTKAYDPRVVNHSASTLWLQGLLYEFATILSSLRPCSTPAFPVAVFR